MSLNMEQFLNQAQEAAFSTQVEVCPEGEFLAMSTEVEVREIQFKRGDKAGTTGYSMDVTWEIQDEAIASQLGRKPKVRQSFLLDFKEGSTVLDNSKGKNVYLGRLREALGQNRDGAPWAPSMLNNQLSVVKIKHRIDGDKLYAEVNAVRAP